MSQNGAHKQSDKLLLFGSFTEDEIKSFKRQPSVNAVETSLKKDLQFGSLDIETVRSLGSLNLGDGSKESEGGQSSVLDKKGNQVKSANIEGDALQRSLGSVKENGSAHTDTSIDCFVVSKGAKEIEGNTTAPVPQNKTSSSNQSGSSNSHGLESITSIDNHVPNVVNSFPNVVAGDSSKFVKSNDDMHKLLNGSSGRNLLPRGLINSGNLCFLNATLQALLSCSPFVQLLQELRSRNFPKIGYPTLHAFVEFVSDFDIPADSSLKKNDTTIFKTGRPLRPTMFEPILKMFTPDVQNSTLGRPRQEDAQEFLSFVMDQMHDELLKLQGHISNSGEGKGSLISSSEDDGWETVGRKNKTAVTRTQSIVPSELSAIFGGQLRSLVKARGIKDSVTVQPFLLLHLDIYPEAVRTVEDALRLFSVSETLEGYRPSTAGKAGVVSASKSFKIQTLSKIMILHLMRFGYGSQGSTKLHKPVRFPLELTVGRDLLVSPSSEGRKYKLVATVTHHGREPSKGHYTADCLYADGQWLHYDDASVSAIGVNKVLHDQAYVLFYKQA